MYGEASTSYNTGGNVNFDYLFLENNLIITFKI